MEAENKDTQAKEKTYIIRDIDDGSFDKLFIMGTKERILKHLSRAIDEGDSFSDSGLREVTDIKNLEEMKKKLIEEHKHELFFIEYFRGSIDESSGFGASTIVAGSNEAKKWILEHLNTEHIQPGIVKYTVYPIYYLDNEHE